MSKAKHEALRKDIEDYKVMLIKYQSLRVEQEILVGDLKRQSELLNAKNETLVDAQKRVAYLESELNTLRVQIEAQSLKVADLERSYGRVAQNYYVEKGKVYRMKKGQAKLRAWQGLTVFFFCAMLIVGSNH